MNKKADIATGLFVGITIMLLIILMMKEFSKECRRDTDCGDDFYCGSDFRCHQFKVVERSEVKVDLVKPALILGVAIVAGAIIIRYKNLPRNNN